MMNDLFIILALSIIILVVSLFWWGMNSWMKWFFAKSKPDLHFQRCILCGEVIPMRDKYSVAQHYRRVHRPEGKR